MRYLLSFFILATFTAQAQDPHFSMFTMPTMYLNPGLTGASPGWEANIHYRNQWPAIYDGYKTLNVALQKHLNKGDWGVGLNVINDRVSVITTTGVGISTAKYFSLGSKAKLSFGLDVAFRQKNIDFTEVVFGDQIDTRSGFISTTNSSSRGNTSSALNVGSGLNLKLLNLDFGIALFNMFSPDEGFISNSKLPRRWSSYARYKFEFDKGFELSPVVQVQKQKDFQTLVFGAEGKFKILTFLLAYRNQDALIFGFGFKFKKVHLQYAYDYTTSELNSNTGGSHEFGLRFGFGK